jgi:hypothetical protein
MGIVFVDGVTFDRLKAACRQATSNACRSRADFVFPVRSDRRVRVEAMMAELNNSDRAIAVRIGA